MEALCAARSANPGSRTNEEQQGHYTLGDSVQLFKNAILDAGVTPPEAIIADGQLHRFKIDSKPNGADGRPAGYFQDFKQGIKQNWKLEGHFMPLSDVQRRAFKVRCQREAEQRQAEDVAKHKAAAIKAVFIWTNAKLAPDDHPYLVKKHIKLHGARSGRGNTLIIPLYNIKKELVSLQFISETGDKRLLSGGLKKGCFYSLGKPTDRILICEGFATGASLFENNGYMTVVAFDASNLKDVAILIKSLRPDAEIIICGDNDLSGTGQKAARSAALACGGKYILPPTLGDFNDHLTGSV